MGTVVSFDLRPDDLGESALLAALSAACAILHAHDAQLSTWKPRSALNRVRRGELDAAHAPACVAEVLRRSAQARELSGGWFDPWRMPGGVDPTGLAKGWIAERALDQAAAGRDPGGNGQRRRRRRGLRGARARAPMADWRARPTQRRRAPDGGRARRSARHLRHLRARPPRARPPLRPLSAGPALSNVTGPELDLADALATGLLAAGERGLAAIASLDGYEAMVFQDDGTVPATPGWQRRQEEAPATRSRI